MFTLIMQVIQDMGLLFLYMICWVAVDCSLCAAHHVYVIGLGYVKFRIDTTQLQSNRNQTRLSVDLDLFVKLVAV